MRRQTIERLLPPVYQRTAAAPGVLAAMLTAMEAMHAPTEDTLSNVEDLFTAYRSPDRLVPFLLRWLALEYVVGEPGPDPTTVPIGRLRNLVAVGAAVARSRGTAAGLAMVIATATETAVGIEEPADRPFHIVVRVPAGAADQLPLIRRIVEVEKPAATTAEVILSAPKGA